MRPTREEIMAQLADAHGDRAIADYIEQVLDRVEAGGGVIAETRPPPPPRQADAIRAGAKALAAVKDLALDNASRLDALEDARNERRGDWLWRWLRRRAGR